ncbi:hypothetical protein [Yoonia sp.]|uniref:hypothetical protein n=1 Tax=Yoonia sp. TaxID=2212373 RepID=UPI00391CA225
MADPTRKAQATARFGIDIDAAEGRDELARPEAPDMPPPVDDGAARDPLAPAPVREDRGIHDADPTNNDATRTARSDSVKVPGVDSASPASTPDPEIAPSGPGLSGLVTVAIIALIALAVLIMVYP